MNSTIKKGKKGEDIACRALKMKGYVILEKNYRLREGEIDIITERDDYICFVEVKARSSDSFGLPEESITDRKKERIIIAANTYIEENDLHDRNMRFDVVAVNLRTSKVRFTPNAFEVME